MAAKQYLDYAGLQHFVDNYVINRKIGTTIGDMLYVSSVTSGVPTYSRVGGTIDNHKVVMASVSGGSTTVSWDAMLPSYISYTIGAAPSGTPTNVEQMLNYLYVNKGTMNNPMTSSGDIIYGGTGGTPTRLAKGSNGQILKLVSGIPAWADEYSYTLPQATESVLGGVKTYYAKPSSDPTVQAVSTTAGRYYGVQVNSDGKMFVNVPWDAGANYYHTPSYTSGGLKIGTGSGVADMYVPYATASSVGVMYLTKGTAVGTDIALSYSNGVCTITGPASLKNPHILTLSYIDTAVVDAIDYNGSTAYDLRFDTDQFEGSSVAATGTGEFPNDAHVKISLNTITTNQIDSLFA